MQKEEKNKHILWKQVAPINPSSVIPTFELLNSGVNKFTLKLKSVQVSESPLVVFDSLQSHGLFSPWNSPGQNTEVGSLSLLQRIFPTQGSNTGLPHRRQTLYQLSHNSK